MNHEDRIRQRAHRIWEEEGRPHGRQEEHWQRACQDIEDEDRTNAPAGTGRPGGVPSSGDPTAVQTAGDIDAGVPDRAGVDDLSVGANRSTPSDNRPAGTLPKRPLL